MNYKSLFLVVICFLAVAVNAEAANKKFKVLFNVVPTSQTALNSEAASYIGRELRALQDVEMIGKDPGRDNYFISIAPISLTSSGVNSGTVVSYVIEKDGKIEHSVLIGGPDELKVLCEKVIAYFDTYWLEPQRKKRK